MGFRPMGMWHRPIGFFPMGGLFILPALMFGGWIAIAVVGGIMSLIGTLIGGIFSGLSYLASGVFSGNSLVIGIVIGLVAFYYFRNCKSTKSTGEVE
jgi:branched-subunit amino acid ABC-type transport system permease component